MGEDVPLRFLPIRFNDAGQALDPMGLAAPEIACPHCRRVLPPCFFEVKHHILSLVGAPSAGNSYYLSVLLKTLGDTLSRQFGLSLVDADPTGNVLLNQMKNRLFSAEDPLEALLDKTALEGAMYERLPRIGKWVSLPRPFIYRIGNPASRQDGEALVFYDNAGEHFEPGIDTEDSPGAMHVAYSSGLLFLFDPTANPHFRRRLQGASEDPQILQKARLDQQDSIFSEMEVRVKRILGIPTNEKCDIPLAFIVGKSDVLRPLLDWSEFSSPVKEGVLDMEIIDRTSDRLREFLLEIDPALVRQAEQFARTVRYFPVSALGNPPLKFKAPDGREMLAPDPQKIRPWLAEVPVLWLLHRFSEKLIPGK